MDKTLENTLKTGMNTKLSTCDDKGVFTDDEDTYRKRKLLTVGRRLVGDRVQRRWLSHGVSQWLESGLFDLWVNVCKRFHIAQSLIIKWFSVKWLDNQIIWYWISVLCLIIKGLDNQDQKLNYQINQYPPKSLIVSLECHRWYDVMMNVQHYNHVSPP